MPCLDLPPYDVVVFVLDDLRVDQLQILEQTLQRLEPEAVSFERSYVTTPMCCPERASFLSGGWLPQNTGVLTNEAPMGGATVFFDERTMATRLESAGYTTALIGKYLNEYNELGLYVPPGWTDWAATIGEYGWVDFDAIVGSSTPDAPAEASLEPHDGYITDWHGEKAISVWESSVDRPLFLYLSFHAPHDPHLPAAQDRGSFADFTFRGGAYEEQDLSDKPAWMQQIPLLSAEEQAEADAVVRQRQQTLLAVDRAMAGLIDAVRASPRADRTVFVLTSDNGMMWREHRLDAKGVAYEESVRVPLLIAHPDLSPAAIDGLVAMNLDLAATVQALAGLPIEGDGQSLLPMLCEGADSARDAVFLQGWGSAHGAWSAVVTATDKLIEGDDGSVELYDLIADPYELESQHGDLVQRERIRELSARLAEARGLSLGDTGLPGARVGSPYHHALSPPGGEAPITWLAMEELPPGLSLSVDGVIEGTPTEAGEFSVAVQATDASVSPVHGGPQVVVGHLRLRVLAAEPERCGCGDGRAGVLGLLLGIFRRNGRRGPRVGAAGGLRPV